MVWAWHSGNGVRVFLKALYLLWFLEDRLLSIIIIILVHSLGQLQETYIACC